MDTSGDSTVKFKTFLEEFCKEHNGPVTAESALPFRLQSVYLIEEEVEGEAIDWTIQYLHLNKCPDILTLHIARTVAEELKGLDLTQFQEPPGEGLEGVGYGMASQDGGANTLEEREHEDKVKEKREHQEPQLEVDKLCREVFTHVHKVCEEWNRSLPALNIPEKCPVVSSHAIKNTRRKMEDRHITIPHLQLLFKSKHPQSYYAVFDGHGGVDAAIYAAAHLHGNMVQYKTFELEPGEALRGAFLKTDADFVKKAERERIRSGTTGVSCLIRDRKLYVAWLGDSQTLLVRNGKPVTLMTPHKPEREDEKKRIEDMGGCVVWFGAWRVNGNLSVSRAIGDADYKPYISGEPDVAEFDLDGTEDYLVLACDGMWDTITPNDLVKDVYDHVTSGADRSATANKLVTLARDRGSSDNISVIVVYLREDIGEPKPIPEVSLFGGDGEQKEGDDDSEDAEPGSHDNESPEANGDDTGSSNGGPEQGSGNEGDVDGEDRGRGDGGGGDSDKTPPANIPSDSSGSKDESGTMGCVTISAYANQSQDMSGSGQTNPGSDVSIAPGSQQESPPESYSPRQPSKKWSQSHRSQRSNASDAHSDASTSEILLLSQTGHRCVNSRRGKRSRSGKRRTSLKEGRRGSKEKALPGLAHRTNGTPPKVRSGSMDMRLRESLRASQRSISKTGDHLVQLLTGYHPKPSGRSLSTGTRWGTASNRWTVAVEIESASAMFEDKLSVRDKPKKTRRSSNI